MNAANIAKEIRRIAGRSKNEEEVKFGIEKLFNSLKEELGLQSEAKYERTIYKARRADAIYPAIIIEYKSPGRLRSKSVQREAIDELSDYLKGMAKREVVPRKYVGIAIDGRKILFVRARPTKGRAKQIQVQITLQGEVLEEYPSWEIQGPMPVNEASIEQLILYFRGLSRRILTADSLAEDFGSKSEIGRKSIRVFYNRLTRSDNPKVHVLFDEWKRIFGIVYGEDLTKAKKDLKDIIKEYNLEEPVDLQEILFTIHTYFAFLMKLIAAEVLSLRAGSLISSLAKQISTMNGEELRRKIEDLEEGGLFKRLGIKNYMEGDFFSWYLNEWDDEVGRTTRHIAQNLSNYEPATTTLEPEEARDLLKKLYQYLVPKSIRHDLGEYYTPDWLAEFVLEELGYEGNPEKRLLDPACGSGTFPVLIVKKVLTKLKNYPERFDKTEVLKKILSNVVGFDINPIAVLAARTNYILAISELKKAAGIDEIEIPIYLADSILTPKKYMAATGENEYKINTTAGTFRIPDRLVGKEVLDNVLSILEESVEMDANYGTFLERLEKEIPRENLMNSKRELKGLFNLMRKLEREGKNKIWARIIKNNFAPIYLEKFDYVVGNPPWINWENLSEEYREATIPLWTQYGLYEKGGGFESKLGGIKGDISMLFVYGAMDNYLSPGGKLGFVITQSVFKVKGIYGEGFRRFIVGKKSRKAPFRVEKVNDMVQVKPFRDVGNRTSTFMAIKGKKTEYPVRYDVWTRKTRQYIPPDLSFEEAMKRLQKVNKHAAPVDKKNKLSPWLTVRKEAIEPIRKVLGESDYRAYEGVNTLGANGVYWIDILHQRKDGNLIIKNLPEAGRKDIIEKEALVEGELVYPLLRGRDVKDWSTAPQHSIVLPVENIKVKKEHEAKFKVNYPKTYAFLKNFEEFLVKRSGLKTYFSDGTGKIRAPFYATFNVGQYTFASYKVVWKEQASLLTCAVVDTYEGQKVIPDHKLMLVPFEDEQEAHYCCALLSSSPCQATVKSYVISTQTSTHVLDYINIPKFEPNNDLHQKLAKLSIRAHDLAREGKGEELQKVEDEIDKCACQIWDINKMNELETVKQELMS